jgi:hypothetical protein
LMQYRLTGEDEAWVLPFAPTNRISDYDAA